MISQLLRHGIGRPTLSVVAGLAFLFSASGFAQAQVATHTNLASSTGVHGVTFTATVSDIAGNPATSGTVSFVNAQGGSLGSAFVKDGQASLTVDQQVTGRVYADYSGSTGFRASNTEASVSSDATSAVPDFTITASPSSASVTPGQFATYALTITPLNGFNEMVTLSCSNNPSLSNCYFSPTTVIPNGKAVTSTLQITTQAPSGTAASLNHPGNGSHIAFAIGLPGLIALLGLGGLRRRSGLRNTLRMIALAALVTGFTLGLSACSQRYDYFHHPPEGNGGIAAGSYTVTLAAYANNGTSVTSHTLNVTLTVN